VSGAGGEAAGGARIEGGGGPLFAWGCLQTILGLGLFAWTQGTPALLFLGSAAPVFAFAAWNRVRPPRDRPRLLAAVSLPVVVVATGLAAIAVGLTAGLWLSLVGGEILVFGAVWLARELRDERLQRRRAAR
jgi:hypothetical protein